MSKQHQSKRHTSTIRTKHTLFRAIEALEPRKMFSIDPAVCFAAPPQEVGDVSVDVIDAEPLVDAAVEVLPIDKAIDDSVKPIDDVPASEILPESNAVDEVFVTDVPGGEVTDESLLYTTFLPIRTLDIQPNYRTLTDDAEPKSTGDETTDETLVDPIFVMPQLPVDDALEPVTTVSDEVTLGEFTPEELAYTCFAPVGEPGVDPMVIDEEMLVDDAPTPVESKSEESAATELTPEELAYTTFVPDRTFDIKPYYRTLTDDAEATPAVDEPTDAPTDEPTDETLVDPIVVVDETLIDAGVVDDAPTPVETVSEEVAPTELTPEELAYTTFAPVAEPVRSLDIQPNYRGQVGNVGGVDVSDTPTEPKVFKGNVVKNSVVKNDVPEVGSVATTTPEVVPDAMPVGFAQANAIPQNTRAFKSIFSELNIDDTDDILA